MCKSESPLRTLCLACKEETLCYWFEKVNSSGVFAISSCPRCRSAFVWPRPSPETIAACYTSASYQGDGSLTPEERLKTILSHERVYANTTVDAKRMVTICRSLNTGKRFLDIGAGCGFFSKAALEQGFEVVALEPAPRCREVFQLLTGQEALPELINPDFVHKHRGAFDVVLMSQVLEHVPDLDETSAALNALLDKNGVAAIAVPHFRSWVSLVQGRQDMFIIPPEHLSFFTKQGLRELFIRHGFRTIREETISRFERGRLIKRLRLAILGRSAEVLMSGILKLSDLVGKGMYINMYFQKS